MAARSLRLCVADAVARAEVTLAMTQQVGLSSMASVIHSYPTKQDAVRRCGDLYNRTKLSPAVKVLFRTFLAARR